MQRGLCASVRGAEAARGRAGAGGFRSCSGGRGSGSAGAPVLEFFEKLLSFTGLSSAVFSPLLKTVAIALLGQIAGAFCQDAGQGALGKMVELCGTVLCLCTALPLATMLLELLQELGGGG